MKMKTKTWTKQVPKVQLILWIFFFFFSSAQQLILWLWHGKGIILYHFTIKNKKEIVHFPIPSLIMVWRIYVKYYEL